MMPMMLFYITPNLPSGVGVYWVVSNMFSLFASYGLRQASGAGGSSAMPVEQAPAPTATARRGRSAPARSSPTRSSRAISAHHNKSWT
jgi:hypothetical protein